MDTERVYYKQFREGGEKKMTSGLIICGKFVCWTRVEKETGTRFRCVVTDGNEVYTISCKQAPEFDMGSDVAAVVKATAFKDRVYYSADKLAAAKL